MTAERKLHISVLEIVEELETGAAGEDIQKLAAKIYPYIITQKRLPGFVPLRPRGRGTKDLSKRWIKPPSMENDWRDDWPCDNDIMASLAAGRLRKHCKNLPPIFSREG